jgi:hypothetical protein
MKKVLLVLAAVLAIPFSAQVARAQEREVVVEKAPKRNLNDGYDRAYNKHRTKRVYVIENHRPVRREVFIDERGRYYREDAGQRVFIEQHYDSYPSRYFFRDGRVRPGISINF